MLAVGTQRLPRNTRRGDRFGIPPRLPAASRPNPKPIFDKHLRELGIAAKQLFPKLPLVSEFGSSSWVREWNRMPAGRKWNWLEFYILRPSKPYRWPEPSFTRISFIELRWGLPTVLTIFVDANWCARRRHGWTCAHVLTLSMIHTAHLYFIWSKLCDVMITLSK